jgi:prepilin-type processing-associated H-X9-DG protein
MISAQVPSAYQQQLAVYHCPSRPDFVLSIADFATPGGGLGDYAASFGTDADGSNSKGAFIPTAMAGVKANGKPDFDMKYTVDTTVTPPALKPGWRGQVTMTNILDGTSNTLAVGEKHIRPNSLRGKNEDRSIFGGQNNVIVRKAGNGITTPGDARPLRPPTDQSGALANESFGGPHPGVCQFVFVDGSVKSLPLSTDLTTLTYLVTRSGGEVIPNW